MSTVLLAAPLIVFALVLLLGFTGCGLNTKGSGTADPPTDATDGDDGNGGTPPAPDPYVDEVLGLIPIAYWRLSDPSAAAQAADEMGAASGHSCGNCRIRP